MSIETVETVTFPSGRTFVFYRNTKTDLYGYMICDPGAEDCFFAKTLAAAKEEASYEVDEFHTKELDECGRCGGLGYIPGIDGAERCPECYGQEVCPRCGHDLIRTSRRMSCFYCGWDEYDAASALSELQLGLHSD